MFLAQPAVEPVGEAGVEEHLQQNRHREQRDHQRLRHDRLTLKAEQQDERRQQRNERYRAEATEQPVDPVVIEQATLIHDCVLRLQPDVVIVDAESPTRDTLENLATLSARMPRPVVVFAEDADQTPMRRAIKAGVSAYVVAGLQTQRLAPVLQVAIARFEQDLALREELNKAQEQLASRKRIERAKGILMSEMWLEEDKAYQRLRKLAMDRGETLVQVAQLVIDAHDLLRPG